MVEDGAASEGPGITGQRPPSPSHLCAFASGLGFLMVLAPCSPAERLQGVWWLGSRTEVSEGFKMKTWSFSLNFKLAHFLLQGE